MHLTIFSLVSLLATSAMLAASSPVIQVDTVLSHVHADANPEQDLTVWELADFADTFITILGWHDSDTSVDQCILSPHAPDRHSSVQAPNGQESVAGPSENALE